jgi:hypothetical protein
MAKTINKTPNKITLPLGVAFCAVLIMPNMPVINDIRAIKAALYPFNGFINFSIVVF